MIDNAECGVDIVRRENKVPKVRYLHNPAQVQSVQCGVMRMSVWYACGMHATMTPAVAYPRYAAFPHEYRHPKPRPSALLGVNRITCFQHATINWDYH